MPYLRLLLICYIGVLTACTTSPSRPTVALVQSGTTSDKVLNAAYSWLGTPYRYGGSSKSGMDCSGLVYRAYANADIQLPRSSYQQSRIGERISRKEAKPGDLIFFRTTGRQISHVGIINQVKGNEIQFIHASESRGVMISSSENVYWKRRVVQLNRVIKP